MAEMEKEGRPPENKRSRKPAHPVKREINEEMKSFAENTMNELLGWYGYDKVELRDTDNLDVGETPQHISVLKENLLPKIPSSAENSDAPLDRANSSLSAAVSRNGATEPSTTASMSAPGAKDHGGLPIMMPMISPPLIKPPTEEDASNLQIMCAWCQKVGIKRYSLSMGSELKNFCSEKCFAACRRAYFKRNKHGYVRNYAERDDDGLGGKLPQHNFTQDTPRLVFKTNSDVLVCDWCKHIRHTKEYLDFGAGERRLQFCSAKCLNQYKMDIFYKETQAALPGALCNPGHGVGGDGKPECGGGVQLLTPESWGTPLTDLRRTVSSPGGPPPPSSPSDTGGVCSPSSCTKIPTPRPRESPTLPPQPPPPLHAPMGVPPGSPPMVMTPRGPVPLPLFMEHQMMQHMRPPFLRPSAGPNSPLSNPIIPGIGPAPPPRTLGPPSGPMHPHRPLMSSHGHPLHGHPSSNPGAGGLLPPHPGLTMPGLPHFPPVNMMPNGPLHMPPMMNFGMPSLAPLVPPPTLLVPYPVIVPLPVPIPIPIPIPFLPRSSREQADSGGPLPGAPEPPEARASSSSRPHSSGSSSGGGGGDSGDQKVCASPGLSAYGPSPPAGGAERIRMGGAGLVDLSVKAEGGVMDLTVIQRQQQVIHRTLPGVQVKLEAEALSRSPPADGRDVGLFLRAADGHLEGAAYRRPGNGSNGGSPRVPYGAARTLPPVPPSPQVRASPAPAAPCNVIVNGAGWHGALPSRPPSSELCPAGHREEPANGELERDALKENSCSAGEGVAEAEEGKAHLEPGLEEDEEHAYALLPPGGCVVSQPVPKADAADAADKTAILSCSISGPLVAAGSPDLEPPLKRRCLRIRNQNKCML